MGGLVGCEKVNDRIDASLGNASCEPATSRPVIYALRVTCFVSKLVVGELHIVDAQVVGLKATETPLAESIRYVLVRYSHRFAGVLLDPARLVSEHFGRRV